MIDAYPNHSEQQLLAQARLVEDGILEYFDRFPSLILWHRTIDSQRSCGVGIEGASSITVNFDHDADWQLRVFITTSAGHRETIQVTDTGVAMRQVLERVLAVARELGFTEDADDL